jgi:hypothetical protein
VASPERWNNLVGEQSLTARVREVHAADLFEFEVVLAGAHFDDHRSPVTVDALDSGVVRSRPVAVVPDGFPALAQANLVPAEARNFDRSRRTSGLVTESAIPSRSRALPGVSTSSHAAATSPSELAAAPAAEDIPSAMRGAIRTCSRSTSRRMPARTRSIHAAVVLCVAVSGP